MLNGARDWRIDWLRGLALVSIYINHMPGNRFENWTTRNFGFSDAAEVFVLLAGVAAAFAYFKKYEQGLTAEVSWKAARRAGTLYGAHLASTLAAIVLFAVTARVLGNPEVLDLIGIAPLLAEPLPGLIGIVTGGYQLGYFNILPLYVVLLLALPLLLWLARRDVRLMLGASFALYLTAQHFKWDMPNYPDGGAWFFNPFLWQLIFAIGLALGIMRMRSACVPYNRVLYVVASAYILLALVWCVWSLGGRVLFGLVPSWMDTLHKSYLPPPRLLHVLALAYVLVHSPLWTRLSTVAAADPILTRLGRNALPVFVTGSLASMVGYLILVHTGPNLPLEVALTALGIAAMWLAAMVSERGVAGLVARRGTTASTPVELPNTVRTRR